MEKVVVWYKIVDGQDGSAYLEWSLKEPSYEDEEDYVFDVGSVETFVGSDIYEKAEQKDFEDEDLEEYEDDEDYFDDEDSLEYDY